MPAIKKIFIDTDCIVSFLWIGEQNLINLIYPDYEIIIPKQVYDEINYPAKKLQPIQNNLSKFIFDGHAVVADDFEVDTPDGNLYLKLTNVGDGFHPIGAGEASAIVLAKINEGILASNNLKDVWYYVKKYGLPHITTEHILLKAYEESLIDENQGNLIWKRMRAAGRDLPFATFSESIANCNS